jgi:hypothetical protein
MRASANAVFCIRERPVNNGNSGDIYRRLLEFSPH